MHSYKAYGLVISSEVPLSELIRASGTPDVTVRYVADTGWDNQFTEKEYHAQVNGVEAYFWFSEIGTIAVRNGTTIEIDPVEGADESLTRLYIEGMILAMLLHQRGLCVLHASVVELAGRAVAFLGPVGAGKSSVAAALQARGHSLISDDNAAVYLGKCRPMVMPAFPYLKLFPEIATFLGFRGDQVHLLHTTQKKVAGAAITGFAPAAIPLERLYFIGREYSVDIRPVAASELLIQLIRHSVPTRWGCPGDRNHLLRCGSLARKVKAYAVRTFDTLERLPLLAESVEEHCIRDLEPARDVQSTFLDVDGSLSSDRGSAENLLSCTTDGVKD